MKSTFRAIIILCLGGSLVAQTGTIKGQVLDRTSGLPLIGANVLVLDFSIGDAVGVDGYFTISLPAGSFQLETSMMGYESLVQQVSVEPDKTTELHFELMPVTLESIHFVTVQGKRPSRHLLEHFQETNLSTTENLISRIEGVGLISRGSYAQEPTIRGMSGGRMNITINNMKSFGACTDRMDPISSYVEADALNSIEIEKGAVSTHNGATIGGALNMTMIQPEYASTTRSSWRVKGGLDNGSNERKLAFVWQRSMPSSGWAASGAYRKADNYSAANQEIIPFTSFEKMNLNIGFMKKLNDDNQVSMELISDDAYDVGYSGLPMDVGYARMRMMGVSLQTSGITQMLKRGELKLYANGIDHWMDDSQRDELFMNMHMDMPGFTRTAGFYLDLLFMLSANSSLKLKSDLYWNTSYANMVMYPVNSTPMEMVTWPDVQRWNVGQFVEYQTILNSKTNVNFSMRYDMFQSKAIDEMGINELHIYYPKNDLERMDHLLSTSAYLTYQVKSNWRSVLSLAHGNRAPTVTEAYGYYLYNPVDGYLYLGNPDLPIESSQQIELQNSLSTSKGRLNVNLYGYKFDSYIFGQVISEESLNYANGWKKYIDAGAARLAGVEISLLHRFSQEISFQGGLSHEESYLYDLDEFLPLIPPFEMHGSITYTKPSFWVQLNLRSAARQDQISRVSGENATPGFMVIDLRSEVSVVEGVRVNAGVNNLTNQLYHEHLDWTDVYRPGRNVFASLTIDQGIIGH